MKIKSFSISDRERINRKSNITRYCLIVLTCLVYAYFFGGFFPFMLLYLSVILPVISLLHLVVIYVQLKVSQQLNGRIFTKGSCAKYRLHLENPSFLYIPYITVNMFIEGQVICKKMKSMRLSLPPFSNLSFDYDMPLYYRGLYDIGVSSIELSDLLGLFTFTIYPIERKSILVRPRIVEIHSLGDPVSRITEGSRTREHIETGNDELVNIRDYAYGDSYRKIHWKLSYKLNKYMVRETRNEQNKDSMFILDLNKHEVLDEQALLREDCLIEEIVSTINHHLNRNISLKLCFYKSGPQTIRADSPLDFQNLYNVLSEVKFNQDYSFIRTLDYFIENEQHGDLLFVFTVKLNADIVEKLLKLKNRGFDIQLYFVQYEGIDFDDPKWRDISDVLARSDIDAYRLVPSIMPSDENAAEDIFTAEGAEVVEA